MSCLPLCVKSVCNNRFPFWGVAVVQQLYEQYDLWLIISLFPIFLTHGGPILWPPCSAMPLNLSGVSHAGGIFGMSAKGQMSERRSAVQAYSYLRHHSR